MNLMVTLCQTQSSDFFLLKFSFSEEKATKICAILRMVLTFSKRQKHKEDGADFFGLLRKAELYCFACNMRKV